jgi:hypothetical protein
MKTAPLLFLSRCADISTMARRDCGSARTAEVGDADRTVYGAATDNAFQATNE